jgi:outer membrane protein assembly factor BamD (BamD/ComL family)
MRKIIFLSLILSIILVAQSCGPKMDASEMFAQANQLQKEGKYQESINAYQKLISVYPESKFAPQSQFMVGFIYANEFKDLDKAKAAYEKFLEKYPDHEMAKDAKWELDHLGKDINDIEDLLGESGEEEEGV